MGIFKGWLGEMKAAFNMWLSLDKRIYQRFHNLIIPASNGTTQIDHILVSQYGIFIVETKNKGGWIFGSEDQAKWTQSFFGKKYSFQNPLRQTYRQKKVLAEFLHVHESYIHSVIYFVGDCKFKTPLPSNVINSGLGSYIKQFREQVLPENELNRIVTKLEQHISESTLSTSDHVRSLRERHKLKHCLPKLWGQS
ncbi:MAG: NERD domain-containing protein [Bdellovibrionales bacterium]|nr:NERD domain-containing protein [Bdellovibrionales bacterium]